ncbi:MAG TPA: hypothetical protein ENG32_00330 [bacterium]|nr:hypothetical protein [bacterium]
MKAAKDFLQENQPKKELTIERIAEILKTKDELTPQEVMKFREFLAAEYFYLGMELAMILMKKPEVWKNIRKSVKSDRKADMEYDATEWGKKEIVLKMKLKGIEKMLSALRSTLEIQQGEAMNLY